MSSLLELLLKVDNDGLSNKVASQFGLDQSQASDAIQALMPAFSKGLERNVNSAQGFGSFMHALADGQHSKYSDNTALAFTPDGINEGNQILGHLFKSKDLSRKIAEQASLNSGISASTLKQMLPSLAPILLGALANNMQNENAPHSNTQHFGGSGGMGGANPLGRILEELMKGGLKGGSGGRSAPNGGNPRGNNPLGDILEQMMGRKGTQAGRQSSGNERDDRLGDIFGEMLDGKTGELGGPDIRDDYQDNDFRDDENSNTRNDDPYANEPYTNEPHTNDPYAEAPRQGHKPSGRKRGGGLEDLFGEMFRPSSKEDKKYGREVDSIFDEFLGPK